MQYEDALSIEHGLWLQITNTLQRATPIFRWLRETTNWASDRELWSAQLAQPTLREVTHILLNLFERRAAASTSFVDCLLYTTPSFLQVFLQSAVI